VRREGAHTPNVSANTADLLPLLVELHRVTSFRYRGRDISWLQVAYLYPTFTLLLVVTATAGIAVVVARLARLNRAATP
jgi:hypothetical protein